MPNVFKEFFDAFGISGVKESCKNNKSLSHHFVCFFAHKFQLLTPLLEKTRRGWRSSLMLSTRKKVTGAYKSEVKYSFCMILRVKYSRNRKSRLNYLKNAKVL